jgi:hypothetical protein
VRDSGYMRTESRTADGALFELLATVEGRRSGEDR